MHVVLVVDHAFVNGGQAKVALDAASACVARGHRVTVFAAVGPADPRLEAAGIRVVCLGQDDIAHHDEQARLRRAGDLEPHGRPPPRGRAARRSTRATRWSMSTPSPRRCRPRSGAASRRSGLPLLYTMHEFFLVCPNGGFYEYPAAADLPPHADVARLPDHELRCAQLSAQAPAGGAPRSRSITWRACKAPLPAHRHHQRPAGAGGRPAPAAPRPASTGSTTRSRWPRRRSATGRRATSCSSGASPPRRARRSSPRRRGGPACARSSSATGRAPGRARGALPRGGDARLARRGRASRPLMRAGPRPGLPERLVRGPAAHGLRGAGLRRAGHRQRRLRRPRGGGGRRDRLLVPLRRRRTPSPPTCAGLTDDDLADAHGPGRLRALLGGAAHPRRASRPARSSVYDFVLREARPRAAPGPDRPVPVPGRATDPRLPRRRDCGLRSGGTRHGRDAHGNRTRPGVVPDDVPTKALTPSRRGPMADHRRRRRATPSPPRPAPEGTDKTAPRTRRSSTNASTRRWRRPSRRATRSR